MKINFKKYTKTISLCFVFAFCVMLSNTNIAKADTYYLVLEKTVTEGSENSDGGVTIITKDVTITTNLTKYEYDKGERVNTAVSVYFVDRVCANRHGAPSQVLNFNINNPQNSFVRSQEYSWLDHNNTAQRLNYVMDTGEAKVGELGIGNVTEVKYDVRYSDYRTGKNYNFVMRDFYKISNTAPQVFVR